MFLRFAPLAIVATLMLSASAQAEILDQTTVNVGIADLDLTSQAGHAALISRLTQAANQACAPAAQNLQQLQQVRACRTAALEQAMPAAHSILAAAAAKSKLAGEPLPDQRARTAAK